MTKNPFINALCANLYIVVLVSAAFYSPFFDAKEPNIIFPILFLSVFVLSAAVMSFIFLYQPLQLFLEDKKKEGVNLFLKTVVSFAGITAVLVPVWFFLSKTY